MHTLSSIMNISMITVIMSWSSIGRKWMGIWVYEITVMLLQYSASVQL